MFALSDDSQAPEPAAETPPSTWAEVRRWLWDMLQTLLLALVLFVGINQVTARVRVDGYSMEPALHNGQLVVVNRLAYMRALPQRGDVIVFHYPRDPEQEYIKRVIALPGEHVRVVNGRVSINGEVLYEPYIAATPNYQSEWVVPEDALFVLGDNRNNSSDSHNWGPVTLDQIIGKALIIYWPPNDWSLISHPVLGPN